MGQSYSKEDKDESTNLQRIAENEGPEKVKEYIATKMNEWKGQTVMIGLTGETAVGKSTFINLICGLPQGTAKSGTGDTTEKPTMYENTKNQNVQFWDLPGVATVKFKKENYVSDMDLEKYDYFMIFFDKVLTENNLWLAQTLNKMSKPFSLVRSKIDSDLASAAYDGKSEEQVLPEIRDKINMALNKEKDLRSFSKIFLISARNPALGDMPWLLNHMEECLPTSKYEAVLYSLPCLTEHFIENTYKQLVKRIVYVSFCASLISLLPTVGERLRLNQLTNEIQHYILCFNMSLEKSVLFQQHFAKQLPDGSNVFDCVQLKLSTIKKDKETTMSDLPNVIIKYSAKILLNPAIIISNRSLLIWFLEEIRKETLDKFKKELPKA